MLENKRQGAYRVISVYKSNSTNGGFRKYSQSTGDIIY